MLNLLMIAGALTAAGTAHATSSPLLITFDGNVQSSYRLGVFEAGFRFTGPLSTTMVTYPHVNSQGAFNGTPSLLSFHHPMTMRRRDGQAFTLQALDIGWYWLPEGVLTAPVQASLSLAGGGTLALSLQLDWGGFESWTVGDTVTSVTFEQPAFTSLRYDNIEVLSPSPVPESPAALLLALGVGLLASGPLRRRFFGDPCGR